jgi:hypothetical protein
VLSAGFAGPSVIVVRECIGEAAPIMITALYKYDGALIVAELSASGCGRTRLPFRLLQYAAAGRASDAYLEPRQQPKLGGIAIV